MANNTPAQLAAWAKRHAVSREALADLMALFIDAPTASAFHRSDIDENDVAATIRLEASALGGRMWRNNIGAVMVPDEGRMIRYGLANESQRVNAVLKSSDLIGIMPVVIEAHHVGTTFGRFTAREIKRPGWQYHGTDRETAQLNFLTLVSALGGDATFAAGGGTL
jgi:hypothetical protein